MGVIGGHVSLAEYHFWQFGLGASHCIMKSSSSSSSLESELEELLSLSLVVDEVEEELLLFMSAMLKMNMIQLFSR